MLKVGSKFYTFDDLSKRLEEFQQVEKVQLWVRDSRTVVAAAKRARRKSLNPALKYAELTYSCVFGGRRPSDQTKTHNQTSAGGCPFKVRLSTSIDGQALVVKEICHDHNHEPGKKLHEEPRRLYKKTPKCTAVRKPVRYIVNKQRVSSSDNKTNNKNRLESTESHLQLGQSPFHNLTLHKQQYQQQQQQIKLQLQQHLQQQQLEQQLRQRQAEVIQLDSPDHIDTPDHLSSPDLSYDQLGSLNNSVDHYSYLPPSPISPSLSSGCLVDCEEEERLEPILDLEEALEEALGDLDSVGSMELDANLRLSSLGSSSASTTLVSQSEVVHSGDDHTGPPPAKRQRGRPRKQSFTGTPTKGDKAERDPSEESKESDMSSKEETDFIGFTHTMDKNKESSGLSRVDIAQANAMARQLHVYKPGIDFVTGARLEVLDARDNNWYQCKVVEVDWGELDILVHYERWSNRFDEWLKMDSTRIRPLQRHSSRKEKKGHPLRVGDKVTARWPADGKKYEAKIMKALGDDQFEVLFFDGITKVVRSSAITKLELKSSRASIDSVSSEPGTSSPHKQGQDFDDVILLSPAATTASTDSQPSSPEPSPSSSDVLKVDKIPAVRKSIFDVEIIEQKRQPKRKPVVEELFQSIKKRRKFETSPPPKSLHSKSQVKSSRTKKKHREHAPSDKVGGSSSSKSIEAVEGSSRSTCDSPMPLPSATTYIENLEQGWKKYYTQRTSGHSAGKWDVFFLPPDERKLRSKADLAKHIADMGYNMDCEKFDFSTRNLKELIEARKKLLSKDTQKQSLGEEVKDVFKDEPAQKLLKELKPAASSEPSGQESQVNIDVSKKEDPDLLSETSSTKKSDPKLKLEIPVMPKTEPIAPLSAGLYTGATTWSPKTGLLKSMSYISDSIPGVTEEKKVKTFIPSLPSSTSASPDVLSQLGSAASRPKSIIKKEPIRSKTASNVAPNEFVVKAQHNEHKCPKPGCLKSFRKENLLQMHIKHYHPDILKKSSSVAPNVADLAYARTVGDHLDMSLSPTHPAPPIEKVVKAEIVAKKLSRSGPFGSPGENRSKVPDKKSHGAPVPLPSTSAVKSSVKKKDVIKTEPLKPKSASGDELDVKEEMDDFVNDLEEEEGPPVIGFQVEDPDYIPGEGEVLKKKEKKDKKRIKSDLKSKKRKSVPSESMSEDDVQDPKAATKYRYSKRKGQPSIPKTSISSNVTGEPNTLEPSATGSPVKKMQSIEEPSGLDVEEDTTDTWGEGGENASIQEVPAEIINCGCGSTEEEGLMLQCDICLCWQHGACYNIEREDQVPDKYICSLCDHPRLERLSHKFRHHQDWLKEGRLPRFSFSHMRGDARLESCVRRGHELTANVLQLSQVLHSLRLKLHIAKDADHPKFVMWHKKWNEKEEASTSGEASTEAMESMQDLMDIVGEESTAISHPNIMGDPQLLAAAIGGVTSSATPQANQSNMQMNLEKGQQITGQNSSHQIQGSSADSSVNIPSVQEVEKSQPLSEGLTVKPDNTDAHKDQGHMEIKKEDSILIKTDEDSASSVADKSGVCDQKSEKQSGLIKSDPLESMKVKEELEANMKEKEVIVKIEAGETPQSAEKSTPLQDPAGNPISIKQEEDSNQSFAGMEEQLSAGMEEEPSQGGMERLSAATEEGDNKISESSPLDKMESSDESKSNTVSSTESQDSKESQDESVIERKEDKDMQHKEIGEKQNDSKEEKPKESEEHVDSKQDKLEEIGGEQVDSKQEKLKETGGEQVDSKQDKLEEIGGEQVDSKEEEVKETGEEQVDGKQDKLKETGGEQVDSKQDKLKETGGEQVDSKEEKVKEMGEGQVDSKQEKVEDTNEERLGKDTTESTGNQDAEKSCEPSKNIEDGDDKNKDDGSRQEDSSVTKVKSEEKEDHVNNPKRDGDSTSGETKPFASTDDVEMKASPEERADEMAKNTSQARDESGCSEVAIKSEDIKLEETEQDDLQELKLTDVSDIELPHAEDMDTSDLTHPEELEGTGEVLDNDDGDDLALDLDGIESAGEVGMPENSDLAALLSSHTELEQLVSQASSALAPHVPVPVSVSHAVPAPIIPEAERIEPVNCKLNLLEHVQVMQNNITRRFDEIEKQLEVLEGEMGLSGDNVDDDTEEESEDRDPVTLQARALIKLIMNDLSTVKRVSQFSG